MEGNPPPQLQTFASLGLKPPLLIGGENFIGWLFYYAPSRRFANNNVFVIS